MSITCDSAQVKMIYAEVRQMEKRMGVGRLEVQQLCEQSREEMRRIADKKIQSIKMLQKQATEELLAFRDGLLQSSDWENFQKYAQQIRKIHLGGSSSTASLPVYNLQNIKAYLQCLSSAKDQCEAIISDFIQQLHLQDFNGRSLASRDLSFNAVAAYSERVLDKLKTEPSFEISPIKRKENLTNSHLPQKDTFPQNKQQPMISQHKNESTSRFLGEQLLSGRKKYKEPQAKLINSVFPANPQGKIPEAYETTPVSLRSPEQKPTSLLKTKLQPNHQPSTTHQIISTRRSSNSKLSKVRSEPHLQPNYKNVLEMLQLQQIRFDKLRHGLQ